MTQHELEETKDSTRKRAYFYVIAGMIGAILVAIGIISWRALDASGEEAYLTSTLALNPSISTEDVTSTYCDGLNCEEAISTRIGIFVRFHSAGAADYWGVVLGDEARVWDKFLVDFSNLDLDFDDRRLAIDILFASRDWY